MVQLLDGKSIKKTRSKYIPISNIQFRRENVFQDYLDCFDNFLLIDKHLDLVSFIYLFNQSRKGTIDTSIFIMLIALEKLANNFIDSDLYENKRNYIIDPNDFEVKIKNTKEQFKKDFVGNKFQHLYAKLGNLNQHAKTDAKMEALLDFAEIKQDEKIYDIFPLLRNKAIHRGEIDTDNFDGFDNYKNLTLLCHEIFCNIIQYKGLRFIEKKEGTNHCEQKIKFKNNYTNLSNL